MIKTTEYLLQAACPRLLVLTDISTMAAGHGEPDDTESMVRLMLYSNDFDIQGLIASSNMQHGRACHPDYIENVVRAYGRVQKQLAKHDARYPQMKELLSVIKAGNPIAGLESVGPGKDTDASRWIISVGDDPDPRPLWITVWGGTTDLAQALWRIREERGEEGACQFVRHLRVHAIGDQDDTGPWIREQFPDLFYITNYKAFRGMYRTGDESLCSSDWVEENVRQGHGPLGAIYPNYAGGDPWGKVNGVKEGDTPSYLYLLPVGLSNPEEPSWGNWGGRYQKVEDKHYSDVCDTVGEETGAAVTVSRWRPAFQNDMAARMDWCVQEPEACNHPPVVIVDGPHERSLILGDDLLLDASRSYDPDGRALSFHWWIYPEAGDPGLAIELDNADQPTVRVKTPKEGQQTRLHLIVSVTDSGTPALTRYERLVLRVYTD